MTDTDMNNLSLYLEKNYGLTSDRVIVKAIDIVANDNSLDFEEDVVREYSADKNIIYLNKPTDIEEFALALADTLPERIYA